MLWCYGVMIMQTLRQKTVLKTLHARAFAYRNRNVCHPQDSNTYRADELHVPSTAVPGASCIVHRASYYSCTATSYHTYNCKVLHIRQLSDQIMTISYQTGTYHTSVYIVSISWYTISHHVTQVRFVWQQRTLLLCSWLDFTTKIAMYY